MTTRKQLTQQVAIRMDEVTPESSLDVIVDGFTDGADSNPLYLLIDSLLDDAVLELFSSAPYWRLPQTPFDDEDIKIEGISSDTGSRKIIRLKLSNDFLRVAEINCIDFQRPITEVVPEQSPLAKRQHNRFLMGKEAKPVGVLSHGVWDNGERCREIDCFSLSNETTVSANSGIDASYIAAPKTLPRQTDIENVVPAVLIPSLEWLAAALAFGARGDANHAAICQQHSQNLLV